MTIVEGEMLKNKLTQDLFKIKKIEEEKVVMLEHEKRFIRIWLPKEHLECFFEKVNPVGCSLSHGVNAGLSTE